MISNQIALKPFLTRAAERERTNYQAMVQSAAAEMATTNAEEYLGDAHVKSACDLGRVLRGNVAEVQADMAAQNADPRMTDAFINGMLVTALAMEPGTAVGLDGAMRLLMMGEKPLENSSVQGNELMLKPSLEKVASEMGSDVSAVLGEIAAEYKQNPVPDEKAQARIDAAVNTASVFRTNAAEVADLQGQLAGQGLSPSQSDAVISTLVMNAVAYEPTFRGGLDSIFGIYYRGEKPMEQSSFQQA